MRLRVCLMNMDVQTANVAPILIGWGLDFTMTEIYIGTYHEDGKEPVRFTVSDKEYTKEDKERLLKLLKQAKRKGYWTDDES